MGKMMLLVPLMVMFALACQSGDGESPAPTGTTTPQPIAPTPTAVPLSPEPTPTEEAGATEGSQQRVVAALLARSTLVQIACLDVNADGRVDAGDADLQALEDITGDGVVDDADLAVVRGIEVSLPEGRPSGCAEAPPEPDWQVTVPAALDCAAGQAGVVVLGVGGGGSVSLRGPAYAAGIRWMIVNIGEALDGQGIPSQLASVSPGLNGTERLALDAEAWASAYLAAEQARTPCLWAVLLGHSYGGALVKSVAEQLEEAGLGDRILLTILVDAITFSYEGEVDAMPQTSPVFNIYQTNDVVRWHSIDQPNVENWDASGELAPAEGDQGGPLIPLLHTNIENSQAVLDRINERIIEASCRMGLC